MTQKLYRAAVYVRRIAIDLTCPEDEDLTCVRQLQIIQEYLAKKPDVEYSAAFSDGHKQKSQTALYAFQRMIPQLESHQFDCVVLYSIEQFSNIFKETRHCLGTMFPALHIRMIFVKEDYDSLTSGDSKKGYSILARLLEQAEISDTARREKAETIRKRSKGKTSFTYCPYGYLPGAENTADLIPDPQSKTVIQTIFREYLEGQNLSQIARHLTEQDVPSPSKRKQQRGYNYKHGVPAGYWHPTTVREILMNPVYTGDLVFSSYRATMYMSLRDNEIQENAPKQMIANHHEALVSREDYEKVQLMLDADKANNILRKPRTNPNRFPPHPYRNLVRCAKCGALMLYAQRNLNGKNPYVIYECGTGLNKGSAFCSRHPVRFTLVDQEVKRVLQEEIHLADSIYQKIESGTEGNSFKEMNTRYQTEMDGYLQEVREINQRLNRLFADYSVGQISPEDYYKQKELLAEESREKSQLLTDAMEQLRGYRSIFTKDSPWLQLYHDRTLPEVLPQALSKELIDHILVSPDEEAVTVILKHQNWKQELLDGLEGSKTDECKPSLPLIKQ